MSGLARAIGFALLAALVLLAREVAASGDPPAAQVRQEEAKSQIAELVGQLGDSSFAIRQRATRQLVEFGIVARDALAEAASGADAEVRARSRAILLTVEEANFRARLDAFSSDFDGSHKQTLPGWEQFTAQFGSGRVARQLFVEMQRAEPELLEAFAKGGKPASEAINARCQSISQHAMQSPRDSLISMGTVASMLLVGSAEDISIDEQMGVQLYTWMIYQPAFQKNAAGGVWSPLLRKLLGRWVTKDAGSAATVQNLLFAASYELKDEALVLATRVLSNEHTHANTRQYAILITGRFGGKEHLPMIEKLLTDTNSCGTFQANNPPRQVELQVRDIALAVAVHLTGQNLRDYGFVSAQPNPTTLFQVATLVFNDTARRDEAFKKWAAWRSMHREL
jgi:hypothetical protein